jgi:DNA-binding MarR family transcriptional regulator
VLLVAVGIGAVGPAAGSGSGSTELLRVVVQLEDPSLSSYRDTIPGLTGDYEALLVLSGAPDQRLKRVELARRLLLTPSGVTRLLEGLERAGLVERTACESDLRIAYAQLTDRGRETLADASRDHVSSIRELFEEYLSADEIAQLVGMLGKLPGVAYGDDACAALEE